VRKDPSNIVGGIPTTEPGSVNNGWRFESEETRTRAGVSSNTDISRTEKLNNTRETEKPGNTYGPFTYVEGTRLLKLNRSGRKYFPVDSSGREYLVNFLFDGLFVSVIVSRNSVYTKRRPRAFINSLSQFTRYVVDGTQITGRPTRRITGRRSSIRKSVCTG